MLQIAPIGEFDLEGFFADQRMREIDGIRDRIGVGRIDGDELVTLAHLHFAADLQIFSRAALLANAYLTNHVHKRLGAAIEDGKFEVVELNNRVVNSQADEGGKHVLGSGDEYALLHQASGVADPGHVAADGLDFNAMEIGAAEDDAGARGRGQDAHGDRRPAVQTYTTALYRRANCLLVGQTIER